MEQDEHETVSGRQGFESKKWKWRQKGATATFASGNGSGSVAAKVTTIPYATFTSGSKRKN
eukprot:6209618-Pleurochrysis_carterae.AAC.1